MSVAKLDAYSFTAQLIATAVRRAEGSVGVLVRDVPLLDARSVLEELSVLISQGFDIRIAYLSSAAESEANELRIDSAIFSSEVEQAETWRNERGLNALVVVIAENDAAKLTSLEDFQSVGPTILRGLLVELAVAEFGELNEVLPRWWTILGQDDQVSLIDLIDYYLSLHGLSGSDLRDESAVQIKQLGLLPDPTFFDRANEQALGKRLKENRELALRLTNFSEEDRQRIDRALGDESDEARRAELRGRLRDLQLFRRGGELGLTAEDARQLLRLKKPSSISKSPGPEVDPEDTKSGASAKSTLNGIAVENLLRDDQSEEEDNTDQALDDAVESIRLQVQGIDDSTVRPEPIGVTLPSGTRVDMDVTTDVLNMVSRLVGDDKYGGFVHAVGEDMSTMVRSFRQSAELIRSFDRDQVVQYLDGFAGSSNEATELSAAFIAFDSAREALLPHLGELHVAPLLVATAPATRPLVEGVINSYQDLL